MRTGWLARSALAAAGAACAIAATTGRAHADPRIDKADQLFAEGKALLASNLIQACDKFEESLHYNPAAIGTLLNVALCDEKLGKVASAVEKFTEARDHAKEQNLPEHLRAAEDHLAALASSVPHLAIQLTEQLPNTTVLVDERVVAGDQLGDIAIDPGERIVVVSAPDRLPVRDKVVIARGEHKTLVVPALARSVTVTSSRRRIGQITAFTGAAAVGVSLGLGLYGRHLHHQELDNHDCTQVGDDLRCNPAGQSVNSRARTYGNVGTVVGLVGLAAAGVGAYLWYTAPHSTRSDAAVSLAPALSPTSVGIAAAGRF